MESNAPRDLSSLQKPLEHFRAKTKHLTIHPLETACLTVVCTHLVFLPWAIGGMRPWSQFISLALAVVGFTLALCPRSYTEEHTGANRFRLIPWPKLIKFPLFWIGLALLAYVTLQALNPAWEYATNGRTRWMNRIDHIAWLPSGVRVPFERWGPWRMLLIYGSVFLTICTVWVSLTRRRSLQVVFTTVAINGLLLAALGVAQRLVGNGRIFWFYESPAPGFFSTFVYKNHAGAYLLLTLATCCGLAAWYYSRGLRRMEKSNPSGVFVFFATCLGVSILISYARGVTLVTLVYLSVCAAIFIIHQLKTKNENRRPIVAIALVLIFGYFLKTGLDALNSREAWSKITRGISGQDTSLESRRMADKASFEMLRSTWVTGAGAGSFQFLFPIYEVRHPALHRASIEARVFWEHAHNDLLEFPIELGLAGMLLLLSGIGYIAAALARSYAWENPLSGCIVFGGLTLLVYAWWDFPFQNPAILLTASVLMIAATMWATFEEMNVKS